MRPTLSTAIVLSLIGSGCNDEPKASAPIPIVAVEAPKEHDSQALADFWAICLWENRGVIREHAHNEDENARGAAQITPIYLEDANEWLRARGMKTYTHMEMHDSHKAFIVCQAYWRKYNLRTSEQRARAHAGGPNGPHKACTLQYWEGVQIYL